MYGFKFYFKDGTTCFDGMKTEKPEELYIDFDGLLEWDEYYDLKNRNLTTKEILEMAFKLYDFLEKEYYKIEIVNDETGEIVDFVEEKEVKKNG